MKDPIQRIEIECYWAPSGDASGDRRFWRCVTYTPSGEVNCGLTFSVAADALAFISGCAGVPSTIKYTIHPYPKE